MKKLLVLTIALIAIGCFGSIGLAQEEKPELTPEATVESAAVVEVLTGSVVSIDMAKDQIVVKDEMTGIDRTVKAAPESIAMLKAGDKVKVSIGEDMIAKEVVKVPEEKKAEPAPAQGY